MCCTRLGIGSSRLPIYWISLILAGSSSSSSNGFGYLGSARWEVTAAGGCLRLETWDWANFRCESCFHSFLKEMPSMLSLIPPLLSLYSSLRTCPSIFLRKSISIGVRNPLIYWSLLSRLIYLLSIYEKVLLIGKKILVQHSLMEESFHFEVPVKWSRWTTSIWTTSV